MPPDSTSATRGGLGDAANRVGDRWSLLVIDALLGGAQRFADLQELLPGLAPNVLSSRLKHLEADGVVAVEPYSSRPPRVRYRLTASGSELADALRLLEHWGRAHADDPGARRGQGDRGDLDVPLHHRACGTPVELRWYCPTCGRDVPRGDVDDVRFV